MPECEAEYVYLLFTGITTTLLWVISEILSTSGFRRDRTLAFVLNGYFVELKYENIENSTQTDSDSGSSVGEAAFLIRKPRASNMHI